VVVVVVVVVEVAVELLLVSLPFESPPALADTAVELTLEEDEELGTEVSLCRAFASTLSLLREVELRLLSLRFDDWRLVSLPRFLSCFSSVLTEELFFTSLPVFFFFSFFFLSASSSSRSSFGMAASDEGVARSVSLC